MKPKNISNESALTRALLAFNKVYGFNVPTGVEILKHEAARLRIGLMLEEVQELIEAYADEESQMFADIVKGMNNTAEIVSKLGPSDFSTNIVEVADALGDIMFIATGTAVAHGIPIDSVLQEIIDSNMSKLGEGGLPVYRHDGKLLKGPNYYPPNLEGLVGL